MYQDVYKIVMIALTYFDILCNILKYVGTPKPGITSFFLAADGRTGGGRRRPADGRTADDLGVDFGGAQDGVEIWKIGKIW